MFWYLNKHQILQNATNMVLLKRVVDDGVQEQQYSTAFSLRVTSIKICKCKTSFPCYSCLGMEIYYLNSFRGYFLVVSFYFTAGCIHFDHPFLKWLKTCRSFYCIGHYSWRRDWEVQICGTGTSHTNILFQEFVTYIFFTVSLFVKSESYS